MSEKRTTAVVALGNPTVLSIASIFKALKVVLGVVGPALNSALTLGLVGEVEAQNVSAVQLAIKVDDGHDVRDLFLESDEVNVPLLIAKSLLDLRKAEGDAIDLESLGVSL